MQRVQQIPPLPLATVNRTVATNNTNHLHDNTNRELNNAQQNSYNVEGALDVPEIPTTRGPHHINCNSPSIRANINNLSNNYNVTNNNNATTTVKLTGALLCRPPSRPPSRFTTPRVDLTSWSNQQENITNQNKTVTSRSENNIRQQQNNMYKNKNINNLERINTANIIDNNTNHSNNQPNTQNEVANQVPICDLQPNSNSIRFSVARSEPSIIFRVHNDNADGNNNVNSNISSTVPYYRWSDVKDGRESYVPFQITRDNSPAMTILNVQSIDENAQYSRLSSDIHFMIDDVKTATNSNKQDDLYAHSTEHHEPQISQQQQQNMTFIPDHNTVNTTNNSKNNSNARRVMSSVASSINFVEYSASSRNETLNCTDSTRMNVEPKLEQISNQEQQKKKRSKECLPQSVMTSVPTLKLNNVTQRPAVINNVNKNNNIQTAQTARANHNRGNYSSRGAVTARSSNQLKNKNSNSNNNKKLVPANAVSARIIKSTSNGETTTPTSARAIKHKRRPFIPSSRNAIVRDVNSARGASTERVASPVTMREFVFGNNEFEKQKSHNDVDNGEEGEDNSVERIRHNSHYERP